MRDWLWAVGEVFLPWRFDQDRGPEEQPTSRIGIVAALILLGSLIFASLHIIVALRQADSLQDCVMQGRTNCVPSIRASNR